MSEEASELQFRQPPIQKEQTSVVDNDPDLESRREAGRRRGTKLLLSAGAGGAVVAYTLATGGEPGTAVLAGAVVSAGVNNADKLLDIGRDVVVGAAYLTYDAGAAVVGGISEGGKTVIKGGIDAGAAVVGGVKQGVKEGLSGAAVIASRATEHGRDNVRALHQKRQELESLTPESYRSEVIGKFNEVALGHEQERLRTQALIDISLEKAAELGKKPDEVKGAVDALRVRAIKERDQGEDKISMFLKLRRLMTVRGIKTAVSGAAGKVDQVVYDYGFTHSRDRVRAKVEDAQKRIDERRDGFSKMPINPETGDFVRKNGVPLADYDADTQKMAQQIEDMLLDQEVRTDYILDLIGDDSEETIAALNKAVSERVAGVADREKQAREQNDRREQSGNQRRKEAQTRVQTNETVVVAKQEEVLTDKTEADIQAEKDFIARRAGTIYKKGMTGRIGSLNRFLYDIYAKQDAKTFRDIMNLIRQEPNKAYELITGELSKASTETQDEVAQELMEYKKSRGGTSA
jgi:hypothetical protein